MLLALLCQEIGFARADLRPIEWIPRAKLSRLWARQILPPLPESVASIEDANQVPGSNKTLILIQDAHTNVSGQLNVAKTLDAILLGDARLPDGQGRRDTGDKIEYVFLEAGNGNESLSFLRKYSSLEKRKQIAKSTLMKGQLQGSEVLDLTSDHRFTLWGVEDMGLYEQSLETYRAIVKDRERFRGYLDRVDLAIRILKPKVFNPFLLAFDEARNAKRDSMTDLFELLMHEAKKNKVPTSRYPHLRVLSRLKFLESKIDFKKASEEEQSAVASHDLEDVQKLEKFGPETSSARAGFFAALECRLGSEARAYPELLKYFRYLRQAKALKAGEILAEQKALEKDILGALLMSADEERLLAHAENLERLKGLLTLTLTPEEFKEYQTAKKSSGIAQITGFLNKKIMDLKDHYDRAVYLESGYEDIAQKCEDFYSLTYQRDQKFIENALSKLEHGTAVLITGGYHSPNLKYLLKQKDVSYISITPQITQDTNQKRYEDLLLSQNLSGVVKSMPGTIPAAAGTQMNTRIMTYDPWGTRREFGAGLTAARLAQAEREWQVQRGAAASGPYATPVFTGAKPQGLSGYGEELVAMVLPEKAEDTLLKRLAIDIRLGSVIAKYLISFLALLRRDTTLDLEDYDPVSLAKEFGLTDQAESRHAGVRLTRGDEKGLPSDRLMANSPALRSLREPLEYSREMILSILNLLIPADFLTRVGITKIGRLRDDAGHLNRVLDALLDLSNPSKPARSRDLVRIGYLLVASVSGIMIALRQLWSYGAARPEQTMQIYELRAVMTEALSLLQGLRFTKFRIRSVDLDLMNEMIKLAILSLVDAVNDLDLHSFNDAIKRDHAAFGFGTFEFLSEDRPDDQDPSAARLAGEAGSSPLLQASRTRFAKRGVYWRGFGGPIENAILKTDVGATPELNWQTLTDAVSFRGRAYELERGFISRSIIGSHMLDALTHSNGISRWYKMIRIANLFLIDQALYRQVPVFEKKQFGGNLIPILDLANSEISDRQLAPFTIAAAATLMNVELKGRRFVDAGSGGGILSIIAWFMGASSLVLIDNDLAALEMADKRLRRLKLKKGRDYFIIQADLSRTEGIFSSLPKIKNETVIISNVGYWKPEQYTATNVDSIRLITELQNHSESPVSAFISAGHVVDRLDKNKGVRFFKEKLPELLQENHALAGFEKLFDDLSGEFKPNTKDAAIVMEKNLRVGAAAVILRPTAARLAVEVKWNVRASVAEFPVDAYVSGLETALAKLGAADKVFGAGTPSSIDMDKVRLVAESFKAYVKDHPRIMNQAADINALKKWIFESHAVLFGSDSANPFFNVSSKMSWKREVEDLFSNIYQTRLDDDFYTVLAETFLKFGWQTRFRNGGDYFTAAFLVNLILLKSGYTAFVLDKSNADDYAALISHLTQPLSSENIETMAQLLKKQTRYVGEGSSSEPQGSTINDKPLEQVTSSDILQNLRSNLDWESSGVRPQSFSANLDFRVGRTGYSTRFEYMYSHPDAGNYVELVLFRDFPKSDQGRPSRIRLNLADEDDFKIVGEFLSAVSREIRDRYRRLLPADPENLSEEQKRSAGVYATHLRDWIALIEDSLRSDPAAVRELTAQLAGLKTSFSRIDAILQAERRAKQKKTQSMAKKPANPNRTASLRSRIKAEIDAELDGEDESPSAARLAAANKTTLLPEEVTDARAVEFYRMNRELLSLSARKKIFRNKKEEDGMQAIDVEIRQLADELESYLGEIQSHDPGEKDFLKSLEARSPAELQAFAKQLDKKIRLLTPQFISAHQSSDQKTLDKLNHEAVDLLKRRLKVQMLHLRHQLTKPKINEGPIFMVLRSVIAIYRRLSYEHWWRKQREKGRTKIAQFRMADASGHLVFNIFYEKRPLFRVERLADGAINLSQIFWKQVEVEGGKTRALRPVLARVTYEDADTALRGRLHALINQEEDFTQLVYHDLALEDVERVLKDHQDAPNTLPVFKKEQVVEALSAALRGPDGKLSLAGKIAQVRESDDPKSPMVAMPGVSLESALQNMQAKDFKTAYQLVKSARFYIERRLIDIDRKKNATIRKRDYLFLLIREREVTQALTNLQAVLDQDSVSLEKLRASLSELEMIKKDYFGYIANEVTYNDLKRRIQSNVLVLRTLTEEAKGKLLIPPSTVSGLKTHVSETLLWLEDLADERKSDAVPAPASPAGRRPTGGRHKAPADSSSAAPQPRGARLAADRVIRAVGRLQAIGALEALRRAVIEQTALGEFLTKENKQDLEEAFGEEIANIGGLLDSLSAVRPLRGWLSSERDRVLSAIDSKKTDIAEGSRSKVRRLARKGSREAVGLALRILDAINQTKPFDLDAILSRFSADPALPELRRVLGAQNSTGAIRTLFYGYDQDSMASMRSRLSVGARLSSVGLDGTPYHELTDPWQKLRRLKWMLFQLETDVKEARLEKNLFPTTQLLSLYRGSGVLWGAFFELVEKEQRDEVPDQYAEELMGGIRRTDQLKLYLIHTRGAAWLRASILRALWIVPGVVFLAAGGHVFWGGVIVGGYQLYEAYEYFLKPKRTALPDYLNELIAPNRTSNSPSAARLAARVPHEFGRNIREPFFIGDQVEVVVEDVSGDRARLRFIYPGGNARNWVYHVGQGWSITSLKGQVTVSVNAVHDGNVDFKVEAPAFIDIDRPPSNSRRAQRRLGARLAASDPGDRVLLSRADLPSTSSEGARLAMAEKLEKELRKEVGRFVRAEYFELEGYHILLSYDGEGKNSGIAIGRDDQPSIHAFEETEGGKFAEAVPYAKGVMITTYTDDTKTTVVQILHVGKVTIENSSWHRISHLQPSGSGFSAVYGFTFDDWSANSEEETPATSDPQAARLADRSNMSPNVDSGRDSVSFFDHLFGSFSTQKPASWSMTSLPLIFFGVLLSSMSINTGTTWVGSGGWILMTIMPWVLYGGYNFLFKKSPSPVKSARLDDRALPYTRPFLKPFGVVMTSWPSSLREAAISLWRFSSARTKYLWLDGKRNKLFVFYSHPGIADGGANLLFADGRKPSKNVRDTHPALEKLKDGRHHHTRPSKSRLAMAPRRIHHDDIFNGSGSHESISLSKNIMVSERGQIPTITRLLSPNEVQSGGKIPAADLLRGQKPPLHLESFVSGQFLDSSSSKEDHYPQERKLEHPVGSDSRLQGDRGYISRILWNTTDSFQRNLGRSLSQLLQVALYVNKPIAFQISLGEIKRFIESMQEKGRFFKLSVRPKQVAVRKAVSRVVPDDRVPFASDNKLNLYDKGNNLVSDSKMLMASSDIGRQKGQETDFFRHRQTLTTPNKEVKTLAAALARRSSPSDSVGGRLAGEVTVEKVSRFEWRVSLGSALLLDYKVKDGFILVKLFGMSESNLFEHPSPAAEFMTGLLQDFRADEKNLLLRVRQDKDNFLIAAFWGEKLSDGPGRDGSSEGMISAPWRDPEAVAQAVAKAVSEALENPTAHQVSSKAPGAEKDKSIPRDLKRSRRIAKLLRRMAETGRPIHSREAKGEPFNLSASEYGRLLIKMKSRGWIEAGRVELAEEGAQTKRSKTKVTQITLTPEGLKFVQAHQNLDLDKFSVTIKEVLNVAVGARLAGALPIVTALFGERDIDEAEIVTFSARVFDALGAGEMALGEHRLVVQDFGNGSIDVYLNGRSIQKNVRVAEILKTRVGRIETATVSVSMVDFKLILEKAFAAVKSSEVRSILTDRRTVGIVNLDGFDPGMKGFEELIVAMLIGELNLSKRSAEGKQAKVVLHSEDAELAGRILNASYVRSPELREFVYAGLKDLPEDYREVKPVVITTPGHYLPGNFRYFFMQRPTVGDVPNFRAALPISYALGRLQELDAASLRPVFGLLEAYGVRVEDTPAFIRITEGRQLQSFEWRVALPSITRLPLNAILQGARLTQQLLNQAA